ncbi:MAG TPA: glycosyltransferase family 4 protein [Steroidobacteraceae bacterium]|jgi:glycosyltransferase involved in cell wall biosynthesis|nr:glycosyltransferase family 4 protein [Steroidobacteraceae bacterium]
MRPPRPLRIAQIAPLFEAVPPKLYGGTERVVAALADALVDLGHEVTVFASAESRTRARLHATRERALRLDASRLKGETAAHLAMLAEVRRHAAEFDVLHFHTDLLHLPLFEQHAARCVTTLHGRLDLTDLERAYRQWPQFGLVSISERQRVPMPRANWLATVPHGLPAEAYSMGSGAGGYLAFLGRIAPEKAPDAAIRIAAAAGLPLKIAAKVDTVDRDYFNTAITPLLAKPGAEFIGEITDREKPAFLGDAVALLFPVIWPEPFGLVMIEALACGTPVIAYDAGAVREVIENGVCGYIVNDEAQALEALRKIGTLSRAAVRATFERRFTARRMAEDYLAVYGGLMGMRRMSRALAV